LLGIIALALAFLLLLNVRLHRPGGAGTVQAQLRYLEGALEDGAADDMQRLFPEGYVFTWALYGLASARLAGELDDHDARRAHLLAETRKALAAIHSDAGRAVFVREMEPPYGVFHASWALYLRAEYVRAVGRAKLPAAEIEKFTRECDRFARALAGYGSPFLESYPDQVWPADTAPGIAALGIHDAVVAPRYRETIRRWVAQARARQHPELGALSHAAEPRTGRPIGGVRGESLALMSRLLVDADPRFAREQYAVLRARFLDDVMSVPGFLEYPRGVHGKEDMDTGPLVFGFSGPAVVVGAAAARVHGDLSVANALLGWVEVIGMPRQFGRERVYAGGMLPIGDAFIAWARTAPAAGPSLRTWEPLSPWWYLPFHALSAVLGGLLVWWGFRIARVADGRGPEKRPVPRAAPPDPRR
ncbi:MAG TPA: hypothetical protein VF710_12090, partial [Longimicrobium sp.]